MIILYIFAKSKHIKTINDKGLKIFRLKGFAIV